MTAENKIMTQNLLKKFSTTKNRRLKNFIAIIEIEKNNGIQTWYVLLQMLQMPAYVQQL